ncbi:MAG: prephenate dehydrogenase/arogenate dehydrogenase family protein [Deltaproteobacteria bacterium]|nr:prephenate dehydrogenase/arogenate dehydrogenase family protein [Deltaproteobacteria bacterium]
MTTEIPFNKVAIIGVGLIGGSIAMALRSKGLCGHITGIGRTIENLVTAKKLGVVDSFTQELEDGVKDADLVIVALPVKKTPEVIKRIGAYLKPGAIVTDVGSVKAAIIEAVEPALPQGVHFVGAHPIAGGEQSGVAAASAGLFQGHKCVITPTESTDKAALAAVKKIWQEAGAQVVMMDAEIHDWILASTSHLPHIIIYNLVNAVGDTANRRADLMTYSAGGFKDSTRIASSSPEMWSEICGMNKGNIVDAIEGFQKRLETVKKFIQAGDLSSLTREFAKAKGFRDSLAPKQPALHKSHDHKPHEGPCNHDHHK